MGRDSIVNLARSAFTVLVFLCGSTLIAKEKQSNEYSLCVKEILDSFVSEIKNEYGLNIF
jgi:hypothetical protein